jgi:hypothetical protein
VAAQAGTVLLDLRRWRRKTKQEQSFALEASKEMRGWLDTLTGEDGDASSAQD